MTPAHLVGIGLTIRSFNGLPTTFLGDPVQGRLQEAQRVVTPEQTRARLSGIAALAFLYEPIARPFFAVPVPDNPQLVIEKAQTVAQAQIERLRLDGRRVIVEVG